MRSTIPTLLGIGALIGLAAAAVPFWGDKTSMPAETDPGRLKPGQFIWEGDAVRSGPIVLVVSLDEQRAYVYRNGVRIGVASASTGKPGHTTPTGVFTILQKDKDHHSKTYNNAAMPYTERLTWDGVALHAGGLPGYPSSHGCVHLPSEFARLLFGITDVGMTVVVAKRGTAPANVVHPAALAPVDPRSGADVEVPRLSPEQAFRWQPEKATDGPVTVLLSGADTRALVFRNGVEIGRARIVIDQPEKPLGTHAFTMVDASSASPAAAAPRWMAVGVPGHGGEAGQVLDPAAAGRVHLPPAFVKLVHPLLTPGATMLVTDLAVLEHTTGPSTTVVTADPQVAG